MLGISLSVTNASLLDTVGEALGPELWVNHDLLDAGWTANGDGSYTCDGTDNAKFGQTMFTSSETKTYRVSYVISSQTSGSANATVASTGGAENSDVGPYTEDLVQSGSGVKMRIFSNDFIGTVSEISVREVL